MIILTWFQSQNKEKNRCNPVNIFRHLCVILAGICLVIFAFLSTNWGKYQVYIAMCEWLVVEI